MAEARVITLAVLSDVHLEVRRHQLLRMGLTEEGAAETLALQGRAAALQAAEADLVIAAGDIGKGVEGIAWLNEAFGGKPVIYVAGNHEFYRHEIDSLLLALHAAAGETEQLRFLECEQATYAFQGAALRILGCTLWTDYALYGAASRATAMEAAREGLLDHQRIQLPEGGFFMPRDALARFEASLAWLEKKLAQPFAGVTVVVTHHAPLPDAIAPQFVGDALSPCFANDLVALIERFEPALWVHGHTHFNHDTWVGRTRVLSYQWGYPGEGMETGVGVLRIGC